MSLWLRLIRVFLAGLAGKSLDLYGLSSLFFKVMPTDLDVNIHMNNARYLALMDLGRVDLIVRTGLWRLVWRQRWQPVIGGAVVRFKRPLRPFQRFRLESRLLSWDEKWIYIEHRVLTDAGLACQAVVRAGFVGAKGLVAPAEVARALGQEAPPPPLPQWAGSWRDLDASMNATAA
ncbi:thioesterase family protein [Pararhodospirillum oryzae]|uniref:Thioesterase n=1 Tax=Pararhodospirillum oryzae TaxID=478448 RepID=A0A512H3C6_9PROT|nr:thioesterase family protein [Pararhodospirillum oryzae]GEO79941.1 thioesterase [Pararhodospirillum oryzae]